MYRWVSLWVLATMYLSVPCVYMFIKCATLMQDKSWCEHVLIVSNFVLSSTFVCVLLLRCYLQWHFLGSLPHFVWYVHAHSFIVRNLTHIHIYILYVCICTGVVCDWIAEMGRIWGRGPILCCIYNPTLSVYPILYVRICTHCTSLHRCRLRLDCWKRAFWGVSSRECFFSIQVRSWERDSVCMREFM